MKLPNQGPIVIICAKALVTLLCTVLTADPNTLPHGAALTVIVSVVTDVRNQKGGNPPDSKDQDPKGQSPKDEGREEQNPESVCKEEENRGEAAKEDDQTENHPEENER